MLRKVGSAIGDVASEALDNVSGQLGEISTQLTNLIGDGPKVGASDDDTTKIFPEEMAGNPRPCVCFTCFVQKDGKPTTLDTWFPVPPGVTFSDSANYSELSLGPIGGALASEIQEAYNRGEGNQFGRAFAAGVAGTGGVIGRLFDMKASEVATITRGVNPYADQLKLVTRSVKNPNTNTVFTGHGVRTFSFSFKMIAKRKEEAELIRQIHERFRHYSYAELVNEATGFMLAFPPLWLIRFYTPDKNGGFKETPHIPRIFSTYLTGVTTSINPDSNTFYHDGAPTEVDIALNFQETRALTRKDIADMESDKLQNRGIDPETGRPNLSLAIDPTPTPQVEEAE